MDTEIKYAIWKAYSQKCIYSGHFIENFDDLEIDHIIPKSDKEESVKMKVFKYNLDLEFDVDTSIENLVPCFKRFNRLKWKRPFDESTERFFLSIARSRKISVENERSKFRRRLRLYEEQLLRSVVERTTLAKTGGWFSKERKIVNRENLLLTNHYWNSENQVAVNCFLPSKYDELGSCVIEFENVNTMISLRHSDILGLINDRKDSSLKELIYRGESFNKTKSFVTIGTNAIHLENNTFNELLSLLTDMLNEYEKHYKNFVEFIGAENFVRKDKSDCYVLANLSRVSWEKILDYSRQYDLDNGTTDDYCFNFNPNYVIALDRNYNNIKFWIMPGDVIYPSLSSFVNGDVELELLWRIPSKEDRPRIVSGGVWTALKTYNWVKSIIG